MIFYGLSQLCSIMNMFVFIVFFENTLEFKVGIKRHKFNILNLLSHGLRICFIVVSLNSINYFSRILSAVLGLVIMAEFYIYLIHMQTQALHFRCFASAIYISYAFID